MNEPTPPQPDILDRHSSAPHGAPHPTPESILSAEPSGEPSSSLDRTVAFVADSAAPEPSPPLGPAISGYEVVGILGRGGMGVVYKAREIALERLVALKVVTAGGHASEEQMARFRGEARAEARLQHPHIVQVHAVGEHEGFPFLSLEYMDGGSLAEKLARQPQPPRASAQLVCLLARAMAYAHDRGIIHRDLKPANILLQNRTTVKEPDRSAQKTNVRYDTSTSSRSRPSFAGDSADAWSDSVPKIADFGLAKCLEDESGQTRTGSVLGTPSYMAPEQADGRKDIGPAADIWALGVILYEMLAGRTPFAGVTMMDTLEQVRTREPVPPSQLQPKTPRDLETICLKCLRKEPARRYASAEALAEDLRRFLDGEPILARRMSAPEQMARWCRRNPRLAAVSALAFALLVAWGATSSWLAGMLFREKTAVEQARLLSDQNAALAEQNAETARKQAAIARTNETKATVARDNALHRHDQSVHAMIGLGTALQRQLQGQGVRQKLGPEAQLLSDRVFVTVKEAIARLSRQMEDDRLTSFGQARAHQEIGDLLRGLGQSSAALREYQLALDLIQKVVEADADNDLARGNQALMLAKIAASRLELNGDARAARQSWLRAYQIQKTIADHPCSGFYRDRPPDNERLLANYQLQLGQAALLLGDAETARRAFEQASALRRQVVASMPKNTGKEVEAQSYLAEACCWLGQACARRGDEKATQAAFGEAAALCEKFVRRFPRSVDFKNDLADIYGAYGDAHLCLGRPREARRFYDKALPLVRTALEKQPDKREYRALLARSYHRLGLAALAAMDRDAALSRFRAALPLREQLLSLDPQNVFFQVDLTVTLAHCGRTKEAARIADALRKQMGNNPALLLRIAGCYARCAAVGPSAESPGYITKALEALRAAVHKDFKDGRLVKTDPELEPIHEQAEYQAILAAIGER